MYMGFVPQNKLIRIGISIRIQRLNAHYSNLYSSVVYSKSATEPACS